MMKLILTIIIAIMQVFIVLIPIKGKLKDNRFKFPKNFTTLGYSLILCCIITTISTIFIFIITDKEENKSKIELSSKLAERDSVNQIKMNEVASRYTDKIDNSNKVTIEVLAKYGLKYDSAQNKIERLIKDSAKKNITIIQENQPVINVCADNGISIIKNVKDTIQLKLRFCYNYSPANIKINVSILIPSNGKWYMVGKIDNFLKRNSSLDLDGSVGKNLPPIFNNPSNTIYLSITGSYTNKKGNQLIDINDVVTYDIIKKEQGIAVDNIKFDIEKFLSSIK